MTKVKDFKDFATIKNYSDKAELYLYGEIVDDEWDKWSDLDTCPQDVLDFLSEIDDSKDLNIYINSGGGSVFSGMAIYNALKRKPSKKRCFVDGIAGSIASVIAMAADEIICPSNSYLMIHKPFCGCVGDSTDMRKMAETLDRIEEGIINTYKTKVKDGVDIETIRNMVNSETWLTGEQASEYFNITVQESNKMVAKVDKDTLVKYNNVPKELLEAKDKLKEIENNINIDLELLKMSL